MASAKEAASPGLRRLDKDQQGRDHKKFMQISQQFVNKWSHPDGPVHINGTWARDRGISKGHMKKPDKSDIIDIFECQCGPGLSRAHEQYCQQLEDKGVRRKVKEAQVTLSSDGTGPPSSARLVVGSRQYVTIGAAQRATSFAAGLTYLT